jgi:cell division protein FtsQ
MTAGGDRFSRRRLRARLVRYRVQLLVLLGLGVAGAVVWLVYFSTVLGVHRVEVEGNSLLSADQVEQAAGVELGSALAGVDIDAVAERVAALPPVASVEVERRWPRGLAIVVTERRAVAVVQEGGALSGMDAEGVLFRSFDDEVERLPLVDAEQLDPAGRDDALAEVATAVAALEPVVARRVDHVEVASRDSIVLVLNGGDRVMWGSAEQSSLKGRVLTVLLDEEATRYDVSVPAQPTTRQ